MGDDITTTLVDLDLDGGNDGGGGFCVVVEVELASEDVGVATSWLVISST
jgi:hypothetical protein